MPGVDVFDRHTAEYEDWFVRNRGVYISEIELLKTFIPAGLRGVEIGIGTGLFAQPLGISFGLEPSESMARVAESRRLTVALGFAENMPLPDAAYDFALMVTTICFLDDPKTALKETLRILKPGGFILIGFVPAESALGRRYLQKKDQSLFYGPARFFSTTEVLELLRDSGFRNPETAQTLLDPDNRDIQLPVAGHDRGGFVGIKAWKTSL